MYDVVIIGAGAAGLMAAGVAASAGRKTLLVEKMEKSGRKIRITGKGRCNLTNMHTHEVFLEKVKANRDFFKPSFQSFDNKATLRFFRKEGVKLTVERGERVFPESGRAWEIADALTDWAVDSGAEIMYHTRATGLRTVAGKVNGVRITTRKGYERVVDCNNVVICTGGVSYPATGSTGDGYEIAHRAGHRIEEVRPSLVPLVSKSVLAGSLGGVNLKNVNVKLLVDAEVAAEAFGEMNFGSRGIEGPVILRLSRQAVDTLIAEKRVSISLDLKSALTEEVLSARIDRELEAIGPDGKTGDLLRKLLPRPLVEPFAGVVKLRLAQPLSRLEEQQKTDIIAKLKDLRLRIDDYGTFEQAVVTAGGVAVEDVDPQTLESRLLKGLYFAGEVLDIDADTGGYNLQIAFSTGYLAGQLKNAAV